MVRMDPPSSFAVNREFIRESMSTALLSRERELWLARLWRETGDEAALHELVMAYMRLVISTAARFRNYGLPMSDLVQEGATGLMQAAARFEPEREVRFSTYAAWWIRSAMQDYILRNWSVVRTGTTAAQKALFFNLRRLRAKIGDGSGGPLDDAGRAFIASELSVHTAEVEAMEMRLAGGDQ
jgi:RNA polymerase sigma-32 factor